MTVESTKHEQLSVRLILLILLFIQNNKLHVAIVAVHANALRKNNNIENIGIWDGELEGTGGSQKMVAVP